MLAVSWDRPFDDAAWWFEPKLDGVRAIVHVGIAEVVVWSRSGRVVSETYPELQALRGQDMVLDGEIVAFDMEGRPSFEHLQSRIHARGARARDAASTQPVSLVAFDLLEIEGRPVVGDPLEDRVATLQGLELPDVAVASDPIPEHGEALFDAVVSRGLEGVMAKRLGSIYRPGTRSPDWRKIPNIRRTRGVVGGFTPGEGRRRGHFGALLMGLWDGDRLRWSGAVGTGFDDQTMRAIRAALDEMQRPDSPFHPDPGLPKDAIWVEPHLVAEIAFKEWTSVGRMRAPSFKGFSTEPHEKVTWAAEFPPSPAPPDSDRI
jgi:bifunctional non-homologous end joining protein LigD